MEASASQMAIVKRIEGVIETAYKEMTELQNDLTDINDKLLPAQPPVKEAQPREEKGAPSGWFEEILQNLTSLRGKIQVTRLEESQRLKRAVAAGEVVRTDGVPRPSKF